MKIGWRVPQPIYYIIWGLIMVPIFFMGWYSYRQSYDDMTEMALSRRQNLAHLGAVIVEERLDHLKEIGVSLSTRVRFRALVEEEKWSEAIKILQGIPQDFPDVDRLFLADTKGVLQADLPSLPDVIGKSFAHRDWYQGVSREWKPYISEVYKRSAPPQINVIACAVPVRANDGSVSGILVLQIRSEIFFDFSKEVLLGKTGFAYLVDKRGHVASHPRFSREGEIIDLGGVPVVQKALEGGRGVLVGYNPVEKEDGVAAYEMVPGYGWAVVVQEPVREAFMPRDRALRLLLLMYGLVTLMSFPAAYFIYAFYARAKRVNAELEKRVQERTFVLAKTNEALGREVRERIKAEADVRTLNLDLERRVQERTAELEAALKEVRAANRELETFSHAVSHDLKAPLFTINGFVGALLEDYGPRLDADAQHYLQAVRKSSRDMGTLLDDLLVYGRLGREAYYSPRLIQMDELVNSVFEEVKALDPNRKVQTVVKKLLPAVGSFSMIRQVFRNLISNAFKFTKLKEDAVIEVGCEEKPNEIIYYVRDNGAGFDMVHVQKLFGVFQRLHSAEDFEGHGLGLAITERIVHRHEGRVWAEGRVGQGAVFYFALPKKDVMSEGPQ